MKHKVLEMCGKIAVVIAIVIGCWHALSLFVVCLLYWGLQPVKVSLSGNEIWKYLGVSIPASARFVEGYACQGRDFTDIYVFEFDIPNNSNAQEAELFLREELKLDEDSYSQSRSTNSAIYDRKLDSMGYSFTHYIDYNHWDWGEIHYRIDGDTLLVAMVYGTS